MRIFKVFLLLLFFLISFYVYSKKYEYQGGCTSEIYIDNFNECLDNELAKYDKELNYLYKKLLKSSSSNKFKKTEILWIKFKEEDCDYIANEVHGGLYYNDVYKACLINKTKLRIADLKRSFFYRGWFNIID